MSAAEALMDINWHDDEVAALGHEIDTAEAELSTALATDVTPTDLRIGGRVVSDVLTRAEPYWAVGFVPEATVVLERWATDGELTVRIAKMRSDGTTRAHAGLLARQIRGTGNWFPGVSEKRTAKIAKLVSAVSSLTVDTFETSDVPDDGAFRELRSIANDYDRKGERGFRGRLHLREDATALIDRDEIEVAADWMAHSKYGWAHIAHARTRGMSVEDAVMESFEVQAEAQPTLAEFAENGQYLVDRRLGQLAALAASLRIAVPVIQNGQRIRPTQPQHLVQVRR